MTQNLINASELRALLLQKTKQEIEAILAEIIKEAHSKITRDLNKMADSLALELLANYDVRQNQTEIVIKVRKHP